MKSNREYRNVPLMSAEKSDEKLMVRGYATTFEEPYVLYSDDSCEIREVIDRHAFDTTDMTDVIMQYDHEGRVFARTRNNTLSLIPDDKGLLIEGDLGGTARGVDLYNDISGGYIDRMSMGFVVRKDTWEDSEENGKYISVRRITDISKLYDVSAVSIPANDATSISVRSLTDGVIERVQAERLEAQKLEEKRHRMQLKLKLSEVLK